MGNAEWALVWVGIVTLMIMIWGIYVSSRQRDADKMDAAQAKLIADQAAMIADLYNKNRDSEKSISNLREVIAGEHYKRAEVDRMVDKLDHTCQTGFDTLGKKFDRMVEMLTTHLIHDNNGGKQ